jgi:hypothetical protein
MKKETTNRCVCVFEVGQGWDIRSTLTLLATKKMYMMTEQINEVDDCMYELEHVFCNEFCKLKFRRGQEVALLLIIETKFPPCEHFQMLNVTMMGPLSTHTLQFTILNLHCCV